MNKSVDIEYEATFMDINVEDLRSKLKQAGAKLKKSKFRQVRSVFKLPEGHEIPGAYARVRDESDKITMSLKIMEKTGKIDSQKELDLEISDYQKATDFLKLLGLKQKAEQETYREIWKLNEVEIMIDWWPFLNPIVEIEGPNEAIVKLVSEQLGYNWAEAIFDSIDEVYHRAYGTPKDIINNHTPVIVFDMKNPFI